LRRVGDVLPVVSCWLGRFTAWSAASIEVARLPKPALAA
jgi:hypothetical protein